MDQPKSIKPEIGVDQQHLFSLLNATSEFKKEFCDLLSRINKDKHTFVTYTPDLEDQPLYFTTLDRSWDYDLHIALCVVQVVLFKYDGDPLKAQSANPDQFYEEAIMKVGHDNFLRMTESEVRAKVDRCLNCLIQN